MSGGSVRVTVVNHNAVQIHRPAAVVWQEILESYVDGGKFREHGYVIEPLKDDPAAYLGGYRMTLRDQEGNVLDDRICRVTERDEAALRLSLYAEYFMPAELNIVVNATYRAVPTDNGARYELDAYSTMNVSLPQSVSDPTVEEVARQYQSQSSAHLDAFLRSVKERLESAH